MLSYRTLGTFVAALLATCLALPLDALAERKSPLDGQPAVRHRKLMVKKRFEASLAFESTVNADFRSTSAGGLRLEYHFTDMFSFGAVGFGGISYNTALTSEILSKLPESRTEPGDPTPTRAEFAEHLNSMPFHGAVYGTITPWYGKLAAFGTFFLAFDFYFSGGLALASLTNDCCSFTVDPMPLGSATTLPDQNPNNDDPLNDGLRLGLYLGGGIHVFLNDWLALDLTVRNYQFTDNPSGLDFNADRAVLTSCPEEAVIAEGRSCDDTRFMPHLFMGVGLSILLPTKVVRTE